MFTAQVYKVQIVCLSGIMDETFLAREIIRTWNQENAEKMGKVFLPQVGNSTSCDADIVIGIVGNYIDKAEAIEESVKAGKKVLLFFCKYQVPDNTIPEEEQEVKAFKQIMESNCTCREFNGKAGFEMVLSRVLNTLIIDLLFA